MSDYDSDDGGSSMGGAGKKKLNKFTRFVKANINKQSGATPQKRMSQVAKAYKKKNGATAKKKTAKKK